MSWRYDTRLKLSREKCGDQCLKNPLKQGSKLPQYFIRTMSRTDTGRTEKTGSLFDPVLYYLWVHDNEALSAMRTQTWKSLLHARGINVFEINHVRLQWFDRSSLVDDDISGTTDFLWLWSQEPISSHSSVEIMSVVMRHSGSFSTTSYLSWRIQWSAWNSPLGGTVIKHLVNGLYIPRARL